MTANLDAERDSIRDHIEAQARRRMAALTTPGQVRGFDGQRQRDTELAEIDALLDDWLETSA